MTKLSDLANSFQETTNQELSSTNETVKRVVTNFENGITSSLEKSGKKIAAAIDAQNRKWLKLLWTSWRNAALTVICILLLAQGLIWYQGKMITDRKKEIDQLKAVIAELETNTWGVRLSQNTDGRRFIILPLNHTLKDGWTHGEDKRPAFNLIKVEE